MKPAEDREEVLFQEGLPRAKGTEREAFLNQAQDILLVEWSIPSDRGVYRWGGTST
jgi:hypothetical protein